MKKALQSENHITMSLHRSPWVSCNSRVRGKEREREKLSGGKEIYHRWTGVAEAEVE